MQKLDFVINLEVIVEKLLSEKIMNIFNEGVSSPNSFDYGKIVPLLFLSKSNYDQIKNDVRYSEILAMAKAESIYNESFLSGLSRSLHSSTMQIMLGNPNNVRLLIFHNTLVGMSRLAREVLINSISEDFDTNLSEGILIFQAVIDEDALETDKYIKILSAINTLVETLAKVYKEDEKSEIVLLDSGSDTNIGLKAGIETAKSMFQIFKEVWDYITNHKFYKEKQRNQALIESLSIRAEIQKRVDEGVLTAEEGKEYIHIVKTRTDELIGLKVMPKQIVMESNMVDNKRLLSQFDGSRLLSSGTDD